MAKTISNVLVGVANLYIKNPNDAIAEWSSDQYHAGNYSVKLYKDGTGAAGSTHLEIIPPAVTTMTLWTAGIANNSFWHRRSAVTTNWFRWSLGLKTRTAKLGLKLQPCHNRVN